MELAAYCRTTSIAGVLMQLYHKQLLCKGLRFVEESSVISKGLNHVHRIHSSWEGDRQDHLGPMQIFLDCNADRSHLHASPLGGTLHRTGIFVKRKTGRAGLSSGNATYL